MLQIVISIAVFIYAIFNYKKGLIAFLALQVIWFKDAQILNVPGLASVNIDLVMDIAFVLLFVVKKKKLKLSKVRFPLILPFILLGISWLLSCLGARSFLGEFVRAAGNICIRLLFVTVLWYVIEDHKDFVTLFKWITIIIFVASIFSLIEYVIQNNYVLEYKTSLTDVKITTYNTDEYSMANRGYRSYSLFEHTITTALLYGFYLVFTPTILVIFRERIKLKRIAIITCILCVPGILLTKMRTGVFFVILGLFLEFGDLLKKLKRKRLFNVLLIGLFAFIIVSPAIVKNANLVLSIFSRKAQSSVGGSSFSWRLVQARYIFDFGKQSFFVGFGEKFRDIPELISIRKYTGDFESVWFEQFLAHGFLGVFAYLVLVYYTTIKLSREYGSKHLLRFSTAYWVTYTMTSLPYFRTFLFYLVLFYFIKKTDKYKRKSSSVIYINKMTLDDCSTSVKLLN